MQRLRRTNCLAIALLCAYLLVNDGFDTYQAQARALEEPLLPPLVATENGGGSSSSGSEHAAPETTSLSADKANDTPISSAAEPSPVSASASSHSGAQAPAGDVGAKEARPAEASNDPKSNEDKQSSEPDHRSGDPAAAAPILTEAAPASESVAKAPSSEKDLKSLLENKNDAENDLALAPAVVTTSTANSVDGVQGDSRKGNDDVPVSVVAESEKLNSNIDKFHYSLGGTDTSNKSDSDKRDSPKEDSFSPADKPVEAVRDEKPPGDGSTADKPKSDSSSDSGKTDSDLDQEKPGEGTSDDKTRELDQPAKNGSGEEQATTTAKPLLEFPYKETVASAPSVEVRPEKMPAESASADAGNSAAPTSEGSKPKEPAVGVDQADADKPTAKADMPAADDTKSTTEQPSSPEPTHSPEEPSSSAATNTTTSTTATPTTTSAASVSKIPEPRPADASPIDSMAPAAAAAAAAGSALATGLAGNKDKPAPGLSTTTTTTKAPSTTTTSTARKSSTNRWNSWSISSTSPPPPTRRRPILPSIRRRFRPHNVFPWAMPESYSPLEPSLPEAEPDFGPALNGGSTSSAATLKPKRRTTTTTSTTNQPPLSRRPTGSSSVPKDQPEESDAATSTVLTRRRENAGGKRRHQHQHHHHHHRHHSHRDRFSPEGEAGLGDSDVFSAQLPRRQPENQPRPSHHGSRPFRPTNQGPRRNKHHDDPFSFGPGQEPLLPNRPQIPHGFGLFNTAGSGSPSSAGSGFDLLNPFSWIDEVTKPRPPLLHNHHRPSGSNPAGSGVGGHDQQFHPTSSHSGTASRPSGQHPFAFDGESNESGSVPGVIHHGDDYHHDHHGSHGSRPVSSHGRNDYDDYHDCHGHGNHGHEHDYDRDRDHHGRPYRPPYKPARPGRDDYDDSSYFNRPGYGRPYNRRDDNGSAYGSDREAETPVRNRDSTRSSPQARPGERLESGSSSISSGPRRLPSSMFSPFDTLFGSLDDDLFGGLRSSFIDSPLKTAAETIKQTNNAAFDAIISSPKISLPSSEQGAAFAGGASKQQQAASEPHSARVIMTKIESDAPAIDSIGKAPLMSSGRGERKSVMRELFGRIESLRMRGEQLLNNSNNNKNLDQTTESKLTPPPAFDRVGSSQLDQESQTRVELPPPITTLRGGIKHFLLMI